MIEYLAKPVAWTLANRRGNLKRGRKAFEQSFAFAIMVVTIVGLCRQMTIIVVMMIIMLFIFI